MDQIKVEAIKGIKRSLGIVIVGLDAETEAEWKVHDILTAAHKAIRSIDFSSVSQLPLPTPEPEMECPDCNGRGSVSINGGSETGICPRCKGVGKVKTKTLQAVLAEEESARAFDELESASWSEGSICATCVNSCPDPASRPEKVGLDKDFKVIDCPDFVAKSVAPAPEVKSGRGRKGK